jgi:putative hydrolase of the HAD superfamily
MGLIMKFKAILFDINGTLVDINTDEAMDDLYRVVSNVLSYQGIKISPWKLREEYFRLMNEQRRSLKEELAEFGVVALWRQFIRQYPDACASLSVEKLNSLPGFLAELYRGASRLRLQLYPGVKTVLDSLVGHYRLAALSDAQRVWAMPELRAVSLENYFEFVLLSSDIGIRKPDARPFKEALKRLRLDTSEVLFVGNDMYHDVYGAKSVSLKTVFFQSNQGRHHHEGTCADYLIDDFSKLPEAIDFLQRVD